MKRAAALNASNANARPRRRARRDVTSYATLHTVVVIAGEKPRRGRTSRAFLSPFFSRRLSRRTREISAISRRVNESDGIVVVVVVACETRVEHSFEPPT